MSSAAETGDGFVEVALPVPLRRLFTYRIPEELAGKLSPGSRVAVTFNRRKLAGFVVSTRAAPPEGVTRVLKVAGLLEVEPVLPAELLAFLEEAARYYFHPVGEVLRAAAPALPKGAMRRLREGGFLEADESLPGRSVATRKSLIVRRTEAPMEGVRLGVRQRELLALVDVRREITLDELRRHRKAPRATLRALEEKGLVELEEREVVADPFFGQAVERDEPHEANAAQRYAIEHLVEALDAGRGGGFLLHGVTGSGKTEVYLRLIEEAQRRGRGALLLVPEIALTPQLVGRFRARFGDSIAVLHSGLKERERDDAWRALRIGKLSIAIGARSALFAPVRDLGVIVVDEEHDSSFKQEEGFRYQARDMALLRAARAGAVCLLGTATPSLESFYGAERGRLGLLTLPERATGQGMPTVEIADLRRNRSGPSGHYLLSGPLHRALESCLAAKGQAILFLNRRGFAPSVRCGACDEMMECPSCSVALTEHRRAGVLRCHYCDYTTVPGQPCAACGADALERLGLGTEKLEDILAEVFPEAKVARLDRDTAAGPGVEAVLGRLRNREVDILVGTQMVTKGHDIAGVTLVGVILADQSLAFPDFRASERTFQLLSQVAGRAGRGESPGRVVFQTFRPEEPAIALASRHDYEAFYRHEIGEREELSYAPFARLIAVRIDALAEASARSAAEELACLAREQPAMREGQVILLGPAPAPISRIRGRYRFRLLLRSTELRMLRRVASVLAARIDAGMGSARATIDVDPVSML